MNVNTVALSLDQSYFVSLTIIKLYYYNSIFSLPVHGSSVYRRRGFPAVNWPPVSRCHLPAAAQPSTFNIRRRLSGYKLSSVERFFWKSARSYTYRNGSLRHVIRVRSHDLQRTRVTVTRRGYKQTIQTLSSHADNSSRRSSRAWMTQDTPIYRRLISTTTQMEQQVLNRSRGILLTRRIK